MTPHLRIESDADADRAGMCKCGQVWLVAGVVRFDAEGMAHGRSWCARLPGAPSWLADEAAS